MKGKSIALLSLAALGAVSLGSCKKGDNWVAFNTTVDPTSTNVEVSSSAEYQNFVSASYEERTQILSKLEDYAVDSHLTGLTLYQDGGKIKVSDHIELGVKKDKNGKYQYVDGFGFGYYSDGKMVKDVTGESNTKYKRYFHTFEGEDPKMLNYMNDKGSVVGNYNPLVASGYFGNKLNETKDGFVWYPSLASEKNLIDGQVRPIPVGLDKEDAPKLDGQYSKYRIYLRKGLKYSINSDKVKQSNGSGFNGRAIQLEDYITPYKALFDQRNGLARAGESLTGASAIKGMLEFSEVTGTKGVTQAQVDAAWNEVGVKTGSEGGEDYIEIEFVTPCTPFYAMYYSNSPLYTPIPQEFLDKIGGPKYWGSFTSDNKLTPVDTTLSTGPFVVEAWQADKEFVFKNANLDVKVRGGEDQYNPNNMPGIKVDILASVTKDPMAVFNEYKAGKLTTCGIPKDKLSEEKDKADTQQTKGNSTFKININSATDEEWEKLHGENGIASQTLKSNYYKTKPIMSNDNFLKGLSFAIDRKTFAENRGAIPSVEFFSDNYLSNPEAGISYNSTKDHQDVMKKHFGEDYQTTYGFNKAKASQLFKKAAEELIAANKYKAGDVIEIDLLWQAEAQIKTHGAEIASYVESAWNEANTGLTLKVSNKAVALWSDAYYKHMLVGQYDMAMGGISGNQLNPLNFLEVLKSDNSSGFCLNYGQLTNDTSKLIEHKGKQYTFDALYQVADTGAFVTNEGKLSVASDIKLVSNQLVDKKRVVEFNIALANLDNFKAELSSITLCWYEDPNVENGYSETVLDSSSYKVENGKIIITVPEDLANNYKGQISFDFKLKLTQNNGSKVVESNKVHSIKTFFWQLG